MSERKIPLLLLALISAGTLFQSNIRGASGLPTNSNSNINSPVQFKTGYSDNDGGFGDGYWYERNRKSVVDGDGRVGSMVGYPMYDVRQVRPVMRVSKVSKSTTSTRSWVEATATMTATPSPKFISTEPVDDLDLNDDIVSALPDVPLVHEAVAVDEESQPSEPIPTTESIDDIDPVLVDTLTATPPIRGVDGDERTGALEIDESTPTPDAVFPTIASAVEFESSAPETLEALSTIAPAAEPSFIKVPELTVPSASAAAGSPAPEILETSPTTTPEGASSSALDAEPAATLPETLETSPTPSPEAASSSSVQIAASAAAVPETLETSPTTTPEAASSSVQDAAAVPETLETSPTPTPEAASSSVQDAAAETLETSTVAIDAVTSTIILETSEVSAQMEPATTTESTPAATVTTVPTAPASPSPTQAEIDLDTFPQSFATTSTADFFPNEPTSTLEEVESVTSESTRDLEMLSQTPVAVSKSDPETLTTAVTLDESVIEATETTVPTGNPWVILDGDLEDLVFASTVSDEEGFFTATVPFDMLTLTATASATEPAPAEEAVLVSPSLPVVVEALSTATIPLDMLTLEATASATAPATATATTTAPAVIPPKSWIVWDGDSDFEVASSTTLPAESLKSTMEWGEFISWSRERSTATATSNLAFIPSVPTTTNTTTTAATTQSPIATPSTSPTRRIQIIMPPGFTRPSP
ncbi:hypothetical protein HK102_008112, partial [Quaeritorhiza haematococci]